MTEAAAQPVNHQPTSGITCQSCGHSETWVRRVIRLSRSISRERMCSKCGEPTTTVELYAAEAAKRVAREQAVELLEILSEKRQ